MSPLPLALRRRRAGHSVAALVWGGLYLRSGRVRALISIRVRERPTRTSLAMTLLPAIGGTMDKVISKDGTPIAYEKSGSGPALILAAGGSAFVVGLSSGGGLALEAAASGLNITKLVAYEPPYISEHDAHHAQAHHEDRLKRLLAEGRRGDAVKYFLRDMVGVPGFAIFMTRLMPGIWKKLVAVAHTLPYDANIMGNFSLPKARLASIQVPSLIMYGGKTDAKLKKAAEAVADNVPGARRTTLDGQTHNVSPKALTPAVVEFFTA